jgi:hypothetical protein
LVTTIFLAPIVPDGVVQVIDVEELKTTDVHVTPSTLTVAPDTKSVPDKVIDVPPAPFPEVGETLVIVGGVAYVNAPTNVELSPLRVTTISFAPAVPAGVIQLSSVAYAVIDVQFAPPTVIVVVRTVGKLP